MPQQAIIEQYFSNAHVYEMASRSALNQPETNTGEARIDHLADPLFLNEAH